MACSEVREALSWAAQSHGLPVDLVTAVATVESALDPLAARYEPHFRWTVPFSCPGCSSATETAFQKTSWGLMQIMGAVARERGFTATFLTLLLNPHVGAYWGAKHLQHLLGRGYSTYEAISAYNQGSPRRLDDGRFVNQGYVDRVVREVHALGGVIQGDQTKGV